MRPVQSGKGIDGGAGGGGGDGGGGSRLGGGEGDGGGGASSDDGFSGSKVGGGDGVWDNAQLSNASHAADRASTYGGQQFVEHMLEAVNLVRLRAEHRGAYER